MDQTEELSKGWCVTHDCQMEWVPNDAHPEDGYWFCELCLLDEEEDFDPEYSDFGDEE